MPFDAITVVIHLENIEKVYPPAPGRQTGAGGYHALCGINLHIRRGEVFGIIGRSGAGKSTLIRLLNLLERPSAGKVILDGRDITDLQGVGLRQLRQRIGMVFQHFNLLASSTVLENVCFPLRLAGMPRAEREQRADEVLALVGLESHRDKFPAQLSGGQRQRVGIARALANRPELLLCDEATSALDPETTQSILRLLTDINRQLGLTIVLITHGMDVIRAVCNRVAVLEAGQVVEQGDVLDVFLHPQHDVTRSLLAESGQDADGWRELVQQAADGSRVVRLSFRGDATLTPFLSQVSRELALDLSILQGTVGRIKDEPYGQLVLAVNGAEAGWHALAGKLEQTGIEYEVLR